MVDLFLEFFALKTSISIVWSTGAMHRVDVKSHNFLTTVASDQEFISQRTIFEAMLSPGVVSEDSQWIFEVPD